MSGYAKDSENRLIIIGELHYKVHDGQMFDVSGRSTLTSTQIKEFYIVVASTSAHLTGNVGSEGKIYVDLIESPTYDTASALSNSITVYNFNRNRSNAPKTVFFGASTATSSGGTSIKETAIWAGERNSKISGEQEERIEWELKRNTVYCLKIQDQSLSNNEFHYDMEFYEE